MQPTESKVLYFACYPKHLGEESVMQLFSPYGKVQDVVLFKRTAKSPTSKGCGLVTMSSVDEACIALNALNGQHLWGPELPAFIVKWSNREENESVQEGQCDSDGCVPYGCDADAVKLYIGNIPSNYHEEDLAPLFSKYGEIIEITIMRSRDTGKHLGCGFLWLRTKSQADAAMDALNLKYTFKDGVSYRSDPLLVRKARASLARVQAMREQQQAAGKPAPYDAAGMPAGGKHVHALESVQEMPASAQSSQHTFDAHVLPAALLAGRSSSQLPNFGRSSYQSIASSDMELLSVSDTLRLFDEYGRTLPNPTHRLQQYIGQQQQNMLQGQLADGLQTASVNLLPNARVSVQAGAPVVLSHQVALPAAVAVGTALPGSRSQSTVPSAALSGAINNMAASMAAMQSNQHTVNQRASAASAGPVAHTQNGRPVHNMSLPHQTTPRPALSRTCSGNAQRYSVPHVTVHDPREGAPRVLTRSASGRPTQTVPSHASQHAYTPGLQHASHGLAHMGRSSLQLFDDLAQARADAGLVHTDLLNKKLLPVVTRGHNDGSDFVADFNAFAGLRSELQGSSPSPTKALGAYNNCHPSLFLSTNTSLSQLHGRSPSPETLYGGSPQSTSSYLKSFSQPATWAQPFDVNNFNVDRSKSGVQGNDLYPGLQRAITGAGPLEDESVPEVLGGSWPGTSYLHANTLAHASSVPAPGPEYNDVPFLGGRDAAPMNGNSALHKCAPMNGNALSHKASDKVMPPMGKIVPATPLDGNLSPDIHSLGHGHGHARFLPSCVTPGPGSLLSTPPIRVDVCCDVRRGPGHSSAGTDTAASFERKSACSTSGATPQHTPATSSATASSTVTNGNKRGFSSGEPAPSLLGNTGNTSMTFMPDTKHYAMSHSSSTGSHPNSGATSPPASASHSSVLQEEHKNMAVRSDQALQLCQLLPMLQKASGARLSILASEQNSSANNNSNNNRREGGANGAKSESGVDSKSGLEVRITGSLVELQAAETLIKSLLQHKLPSTLMRTGDNNNV